MNPESTETSPEVPDNYGGFLQSQVEKDDSGNVTSFVETPGVRLRPEGGGYSVELGDVKYTQEQWEAFERYWQGREKTELATEATIDPSWRRHEALRILVDLLPYTPYELRSQNTAGFLREADDIAKWLNGEAIQ